MLELVEGPTLADRIAQGPIPLDEALPIAKQIAEALEAAHEQGIIHRDLKPANIKVRHDGTVKVLDFGLAKASRGAGASASADLVAVADDHESRRMTQRGVILGTAAYMSPEQAKGRPSTSERDIWAFGCVLYEMLTGRRAFPGEDVTDTLAAVIRAEPEWNLLPREVSPTLLVYLRRSLQKDPKQRVGDVHDLRLALEGAFELPAPHVPNVATASVASQSPGWRRTLPIALGVLVVGSIVAGVVVWNLVAPQLPRPVARFDYHLPEGQQFANTNRPILAFSADGSQFVYNTPSGLYLRSLADVEARLILGTGPGAASTPFLSPDGQWVGYLTNAGLTKIPVSGGAPNVLCAATYVFGASWERDNTILFGQREGIMRVSANGGTRELIIKTEEGEQVDSPQMLPGGTWVLFTLANNTAGPARWDTAQVVVQSLQSGERKVLVKGGSDARYVPTGHLVYAVGDGLFAVPFDVESVEVSGGPVSVVQGVQRVFNPANNSAGANYGVSADGSLVYVVGSPGGAEQRTLVWADRMGREEPVKAPPRSYIYPRISPDGTRAALWANDQQNDIWTWDFAREALTRLTFDPGIDNHPVWTPDGRRLLFSSAQAGPREIFWQSADGTGSAERLTTNGEAKNRLPYDISPDGTRVVLREDAPNPTTHDLMVLSLDGEHRVQPLIQTTFDEANADLSPDGRWLAYESNESGLYEVYVRTFPDVNGGRWQISTGGGTRPLWARDGRELFYMATTGSMAALMRVPIEQQGTFTPGVPAKLFEGRYYFNNASGTGGFGRTYDVSPDGQRFLMVKEVGSEDASERPES